MGKHTKHRYIWMEIDLRNKELPVAVADTMEELAQMRKTTVRNIKTQMFRAKRRNGRCKYIRVKIEEEENEV